jgi:hypothetical protein
MIPGLAILYMEGIRGFLFQAFCSIDFLIRHYIVSKIVFFPISGIEVFNLDFGSHFSCNVRDK